MAEVRTYEQPAVLASGSRVIILVSEGPAEVPPVAYVDVPDLTGETQGNALSLLQDGGFHARVYNDYSESYARGRVMGQLPRAGTTAASGSEVALLVSSGGGPQTTRRPSRFPTWSGCTSPKLSPGSRVQGCRRRCCASTARRFP